jgi:hypothetical protein
LYFGEVPIHAPPHQKFHSTNFDNHGTHHSSKHYGGHWTSNIYVWHNVIAITKLHTKHSQDRKNLINSFHPSSMGMMQEKPSITSKS